MTKSSYNPQDPGVLISAYLDETISGEDAKVLNDWVKADPANARSFAKAVWLHRRVYDLKHVEDLQRLSEPGLGEISGGPDASEGSSLLGALLAMERDAGEVELVDLTEELEKRKMQEKYEKARSAAMRLPQKAGKDDIRRPLIIPLWFAYGVAAMVAIGAVVGLYAAFSSPNPQGPGLTQTPVEVPLGPHPVATLTASDGLRFADARQSVATGASMIPGPIELTHGTAEITFNSGAVVIIAAPAKLDLEDANLATLHTGTLAAVVPPRARGFAIDTPTMRIIDLGTQFGVSVDALNDCEVQVFLGEVTAAVTDAAGEAGPSRSLRTNQGLRVDADTRTAQAVEVDVRGYDELLPHLKLLYRNLVVNGDFEAGEVASVTGKAFGDVQNLQVPGWEDASPGTVLGYRLASAYDYPNPVSDPMPSDRGEAYYAGMGAGAIRQRIDVSALADLIDTQGVAFDLSAWLGGFAENDEHILVSARFLDASRHAIAPPGILEPVFARDRMNQSGFLFRQTQGRLPAGARFVEIVLENIGDTSPPTVCDGYADNISLRLSVD